MLWRAALYDFDDAVRLLAYQPDAEGHARNICKRVEFVLERHEIGAFITDPTIELDGQSAKSLMNALWSVGIRPTEYNHPNGEIKRLEAHLADMRTLVFKVGG